MAQTKAINKARTIRFLVCIVLVFTLFSIVGCSSAADIPAAKQEVLQVMRDAGFKFDSTLVKVSGEDSLTQAKVTGPMIGPKEIPAPGIEAPAKGSDNYIEYKEVVLDMKDGKWVITNAVLKDAQ